MNKGGNVHRRRTLRYVEIAEDLKRSIETGKYPPGTKLSSQHQLAMEYGVAFNTLRQALGVLQNEGYIYSELGRGTFTKRPDVRKGALLVVDDDPKMGELFQASLDPDEWDVVCVHSGEESIDVVARRSFNIIFVDLVMPGFSGPEVLSELRSNGYTVPVVVVTGYPDSDLVARLLDVEAVPLIRKPFNASEIRETIKRFAAWPRDEAPPSAVVGDGGERQAPIPTITQHDS